MNVLNDLSVNNDIFVTKDASINVLHITNDSCVNFMTILTDGSFNKNLYVQQDISAINLNILNDLSTFKSFKYYTVYYSSHIDKPFY